MPEFARSYSPRPARSAGHVSLDDAPGRVACVWGEGRTFRGEEGGFARQRGGRRVRRDAHAGRNDEEERQSGSRGGSSGLFGTTIAAPCTVSGEGKRPLRAVARSSRSPVRGSTARDAPMVTCACVTPASCSISPLSGTKHPAMSAEALTLALHDPRRRGSPARCPPGSRPVVPVDAQVLRGQVPSERPPNLVLPRGVARRDVIVRVAQFLLRRHAVEVRLGEPRRARGAHRDARARSGSTRPGRSRPRRSRARASPARRESLPAPSTRAPLASRSRARFVASRSPTRAARRGSPRAACVREPCAREVRGGGTPGDGRPRKSESTWRADSGRISIGSLSAARMIESAYPKTARKQIRRASNASKARKSSNRKSRAVEKTRRRATSANIHRTSAEDEKRWRLVAVDP